MSGRKKSKRTRAEEEEKEAEANEPDANEPSANEGGSVAGKNGKAKSRTRRAKRPREDEEAVESEKRMKMDEDDDKEMEGGSEEGSEMEEEDSAVMHEEEEAPSKVPAVAAAASAPPSAAPVATVAVPKVKKLRMPSQHTPGKPVPGTKVHPPADAEDENTVRVPNQQRLQIQKTPHPKRASDVEIAAPPVEGTALFGTNGHHATTGTGTAEEGTPTSAAASQQPVEPVVTNGVAPGEQVLAIPKWLDRLLGRPVFWFCLILCLSTNRWLLISPFLDCAVYNAKQLIPAYRAVLGSKSVEEVVPVVEVKEDSVLSDKTMELISQSMELNATLQEADLRQKAVEVELDRIRQILQVESSTISSRLRSVQSAENVLRRKLDKIFSDLESKSGEVERLLDWSNRITQSRGTDVEALTGLQDSIGKDGALSLVNMVNMKLWDPPLEECQWSDTDALPVAADIQDDEEEGVVTKGLVLQYLEEIRVEVREELEGLMEEEEWIHEINSWIAAYADKMPLPSFDMVDKSGASTDRASTPGTVDEKIRKMVDARLEVDRADSTGRIDYAALHQGAAVVRTGAYPTSTSLVDRMPLLNRISALLGAQFYGYGPEAALTPSYPLDALGQCWAFAEMEGVNQFGSYAILTVKLAKPVLVDSIVIEHPTPEVTDRARTAIRNFRVFGFEDEAAASSPLALGSFSFDANNRKRSLREEFDLAANDDGDIPRLRSMSLVIDSTWGMEYACLYRFRVHGRA
jgi:hypothetical protein